MNALARTPLTELATLEASRPVTLSRHYSAHGCVFARYGAAAGLATAISVALYATVFAHPVGTPILGASACPFPWLCAGGALGLVGGAGAVLWYALQLRAALEREVRERTAREIAEKALAQARRLEAVGRLAGGIAHDFNNSLTVISALAEFALLDAGVGANARECMAQIVAATKHAACFTRQLLGLARREASRPRPVELADYLRLFESTLRRLLPSDISVGIDLAAARRVCVDPTELERALLNLILNARDAIDGPGKIALGCVEREVKGHPSGIPDGEYVSLYVRDSGGGMAEETSARLFEPFFTTKGHAGTGLGMSMVHSFVTQAGGAAEVNSVVGEGSVVTLLFPAIQGTVCEAEVGAGSPLSAMSLVGRLALVVEDQADIRIGMERALRTKGLTVRAAADGHEALRLMDEPGFRCDILCVDGIVPGASSSEIISHFRRVQPGGAVLVCSGYVEQELVRRGVLAGRCALLKKPFAPAELIERVSQLLTQGPR